MTPKETAGSLSHVQIRPLQLQIYMEVPTPSGGPYGPPGVDVHGGDVAPVPVPALAHVNVEVHPAHKVPLVRQQPNLRASTGFVGQCRCQGPRRSKKPFLRVSPLTLLLYTQPKDCLPQEIRLLYSGNTGCEIPVAPSRAPRRARRSTHR